MAARSVAFVAESGLPQKERKTRRLSAPAVALTVANAEMYGTVVVLGTLG